MAASFIKQERLCLAPVVDDKRFAGLFAGTPESAWDEASNLSSQIHITYKERPFHTVLSCAPPMYDDVLAHSTHVHGIGTYENGVETPRVRVTLATQIPEAECRQINLGYRNPATIDLKDFADREDEGILYVPKAGERLFHLKQRPVWAGGK